MKDHPGLPLFFSWITRSKTVASADLCTYLAVFSAVSTTSWSRGIGGATSSVVPSFFLRFFSALSSSVPSQPAM